MDPSQCLGENHRLCDYVRRLLNYGAYVGWVQSVLVQAQYWHDPLAEGEYTQHSLFLADINNQVREAFKFKYPVKVWNFPELGGWLVSFQTKFQTLLEYSISSRNAKNFFFNFVHPPDPSLRFFQTLRVGGWVKANLENSRLLPDIEI